MTTHATAGGPRPTPATPVLLITSSRRRLITLVRAVTGPLRVPLRVTGSIRRAEDLMPESALVMVGADKLSTLAPPPPPMRSRLLVVTAGPDADILALTADVLGSVPVCWLPLAATWLADQITAAVASPPAPRAARPPHTSPTTQEMKKGSDA